MTVSVQENLMKSDAVVVVLGLGQPCWREKVYCGFRRQSQLVSMQDGHTNTIYNKHVNTVVLHLVKAVLHRVAVTIVFMK